METPPVTSSKHLLVLLAEDDPDSREMYCEFLDLAGCRTEQARNGQEALEMALRLVPDVLVTDVTLPALDGVALSAALRRDSRTAHIPIIVVTGRTSEHLDREMTRAGVTTVLVKPCLPDDLLDEIRRVTGRSGQSRTHG